MKELVILLLGDTASNVLFNFNFNLVFSFGVQSFYLIRMHLSFLIVILVLKFRKYNINFSSINNLNDFISLSKINWYQDVTGDNIEYKWSSRDSHHYISLFSLYANNIELRDIVAK